MARAVGLGAAGASLSVSAGAFGLVSAAPAAGSAVAGMSSVVGWSVTGAETTGWVKRSMLSTERAGPPMANHNNTAASIQITAEEKKSLGSGKNERNTGRLQGVGKMCHLTVAIGIKQGREVKLW